MVRKVTVKEGQYEDSAAIVADGWNADAGISDPEQLAKWLEPKGMILEEAVGEDGSAMSGEGWYRMVPKEPAPASPTITLTLERLQVLLNRASVATVLSLVESGALNDGHGINWIDDNQIVMTQGGSKTGVLVVVVPKE